MPTDEAPRLRRYPAYVRESPYLEFAIAEGAIMAWPYNRMWLPASYGRDRRVEYEALLNHFYRNNRALGLCQYNRRRLPTATLDHGMATHPTVRIAGKMLLTNPFYELPEIAKNRSAKVDGVETRIEALTTALVVAAPTPCAPPFEL